MDRAFADGYPHALTTRGNEKALLSFSLVDSVRCAP